MKFFQKLPSAYIVINVQIYQNLLKLFSTPTRISSNLSNISKAFGKASTKFQQVFCKIYTNFIRILHKFLKNVLKDFQNFHKVLCNVPLIIFFLNFNKYYSKVIVLFSSFLDSSSVPYWHFIKIFPNFSIFFKDLRSPDKVTVEICPNFYFSLLKNFLASFRSVFNFFFWYNLFFSKNKLSVISTVLILYFVLHGTIYKNSSIFKICSKISQILLKILSNLK